MSQGALEILTARALHTRGGDVNVLSPCISVCRMDPLTQLCSGCFRSLEEIGTWSRMGDEAKRAVWLQIEQRAALTPL